MNCINCYTELEIVDLDSFERYTQRYCPDCEYLYEPEIEDVTVKGWMWMYWPIMAWGEG